MHMSYYLLAIGNSTARIITLNVGIFETRIAGKARGVNRTNRGNQFPCIIQNEQRGVAKADDWINKI